MPDSTDEVLIQASAQPSSNNLMNLTKSWLNFASINPYFEHDRKLVIAQTYLCNITSEYLLDECLASSTFMLIVMICLD